ncbi:hypothetical protein [Rheinheimera sp.]|uniref:hypothetical protein n=1 Tax=Rheinheimera sp. TaxID=1869214 RepID=UPI0027B90FE8|nr:hypothetical protein [Rheinheimera sp.]
MAKGFLPFTTKVAVKPQLNFSVRQKKPADRINTITTTKGFLVTRPPDKTIKIASLKIYAINESAFR